MIDTQALLPEAMEESTLAGLLPGESTWAAVGAMWVDGQRRCWLHAFYARETRSELFPQILISREEDGTITVTVPEGVRYRVMDRGISATADTSVPVARLERA